MFKKDICFRNLPKCSESFAERPIIHLSRIFFPVMSLQVALVHKMTILAIVKPYKNNAINRVISKLSEILGCFGMIRISMIINPLEKGCFQYFLKNIGFSLAALVYVRISCRLQEPLLCCHSNHVFLRFVSMT